MRCPIVTTITIQGMSCEHCKRAVFTALAGVPGIDRAEVQLGSARIEHDGTVTHDALRSAVELAGYVMTQATDAPAPRSLPIAGGE